MTPIAASDFPAFFEEVYGYRPYPWQARLANEVVETGTWPDLLDLPTGTGKTAVLDVALFALASREANDLPRRIVFVVDRRIVVHQAAQRVRQLVATLDPAGTGVASNVARRLRALAPSPSGIDEGPVLRWSELRGGIVRDESWATRPDVPAVLVSTVDQVGSRLLFRGYGVSRGMRPIHAGLLGADTLFLLDEVHLAHPFRETLRAIGDRYRGGDGTVGLPDRWQMVELSATPSQEVEHRFTLDDEDRRPTDGHDNRAVAELQRRLGASKPVELRAVSTSATPAAFAKALTGACVREVQALLAADVRTIGVVVNRVASAVAVERALEAIGIDVLLVTGRARIIDRQAIVRRLEERVWAGRVRQAGDAPLVVVATQAIEAGADLDFDALVSECASLDALRQRFGRVDRAGAMSASGAPATSVVLGLASAVSSGSEDAVYGPALAATWDWLCSVAVDGVVDFGNERLVVPDGDSLLRLLPLPAWCPQLLPSHLDRLVQTSIRPEPEADPVVAHWLHGLEERPADVSVIWRADVDRNLLESAMESADGDDAEENVGLQAIGELLDACPPDGREVLSLPARAVRQWLVARGEGNVVVATAEDVADVAAQAEVAAETGTSARTAPVVLLGGQGERLVVVDRPSRIAPGDTIVVPLDYGGIRSGSWDPSDTTAVVDRATAARALADRRAVLRLVCGGFNLGGSGTGSYPVPPDLGEEVDDRSMAATDDAVVKTWLDERIGASSANPSVPSTGEDPLYALELAVARHLSAHRRTVRRIPRLTSEGAPGACYVVSSQARLRGEVVAGDGDQTAAAVDSEPETSSFVGREVALSLHLSDVRQWGETLASNLGLPPEVVGDVALAGWLHDLGKADPRFQLMLRQGAMATTTPLLAKSKMATGDRRSRQAAYRESGYPPGARHEFMSVALVGADDQLLGAAHDRDLVLHLVASHHGHARPFAPVIIDRRPVEVTVTHDGRALASGSDHGLARLDAGVPERFWRLVRRYGWWELAWLEALLRLADHRASESEAQPDVDEEVGG